VENKDDSNNSAEEIIQSNVRKYVSDYVDKSNNDYIRKCVANEIIKYEEIKNKLRDQCSDLCSQNSNIDNCLIVYNDDVEINSHFFNLMVTSNGCSIGTDESCEINLSLFKDDFENNSFFARIDYCNGFFKFRRLTNRYKIKINEIQIYKNSPVNLKLNDHICICNLTFKIK